MPLQEMQSSSLAVDDRDYRGDTRPPSCTGIEACAERMGMDRRRTSIGFTLLELVVVMAILGTLASIAVPAYWTYIDKARQTVAIADIRQIEKLIAAFQASNGRLPESLDEIGAGSMKDPWGNFYEYVNIATATAKGEKGEKGEKVRKDHFLVPINTDFDLYSKGRDGDSKAPLTAKASRDDIVRANSGQYVGLASKF